MKCLKCGSELESTGKVVETVDADTFEMKKVEEVKCVSCKKKYFVTM